MQDVKTLRTLAMFGFMLASLGVALLILEHKAPVVFAKYSVSDPLPGGMCRCMSCNCIMSEEGSEELAVDPLPEPITSFLSAAQAAAVVLAAEKASSKTKEATKASTKEPTSTKTTTTNKKEPVKTKPANTNTSSKTTKEKEKEKDEPRRNTTQKSSTKDTYPYTAPSRATGASLFEKGKTIPVAKEQNPTPIIEASLMSPIFFGGVTPRRFEQGSPSFIPSSFGKSQERLAPDNTFGGSGPSVHIHSQSPPYSIGQALDAARGTTNDAGEYYEFMDTDGSLRYLDSEGRSVPNPLR